MSQNVKTFYCGTHGKSPALPLHMPELTLPLISQCGIHTRALVHWIRPSIRDRVLRHREQAAIFILRDLDLHLLSFFYPCGHSAVPHSAALCIQAVYHYDYVHSIRGRVAPTTKTVDLDRALHAYKLQSEVSSESWADCPAETHDEGQASVEVASPGHPQPDLVNHKDCSSHMS